MSRLVNFCHRTVRVNKVHLLPNRAQPFWHSGGRARTTGYARDAMAFAERRDDARALEQHGYYVVLLQPDVNCIAVRDELQVTMPCITAAECL